MCSRGTPMFFAGDEFCNTQFGNNNAYCQDNEISWLDWSRKETYKDIYEFFSYMIHFRHKHEVIRRDMYPSSLGFPAVSTHGQSPFVEQFPWDSRVVGVMFAGRKAPSKKDDIVYVLFNSYWETQEVLLPELGNQLHWKCVVNTSFEDSILKKTMAQSVGERILIGPRSAMVLEAF